MAKKFKVNSPFLKIPLWIKIAYTAMVIIIVPFYWRDYGPLNFLWMSDIAMFAMLIALWFENRLITSMIFIGVMPFEILWCIDFITHSTLLNLTSYMFDDNIPLYLRSFSLFHIPLLAIIVYCLFKLGYDKRAILFQTNLYWIVILTTYILADPAGDNINWVFGWGEEPQKLIPPLLYLGLLMVGIPLFVYLPMHLLLARFFSHRTLQNS